MPIWLSHKDLCDKQKAFKNDKQSAEDSKIYKNRANEISNQ